MNNFISSQEGEIFRLQMNDLAGRNRVCSARLVDFHAALDVVEATPSARVLVVSGLPQVFSAGFDLGELAREPSRVAERVLAFGSLCERLAKFPLPTIAEMAGSAWGGGVDLALSCRFRLGTRTAELSIPAARMGLHYHPGGVRRLVRCLGGDLAQWLLFSGLPLRGERLHSSPFFQQVLDGPESLGRAVSDLAARTARIEPHLVRDLTASVAESRLVDLAPAALAASVIKLQEMRVHASAGTEELAHSLRDWQLKKGEASLER